MKKQSDNVIFEDLLGAAAFSLAHLLEKGQEYGETARQLWQEHGRHAKALGQPEQLFLLLRDGVIECSTPSCRELFGAELKGQSFLERVTPESGDIMAGRARDKAEGKPPAREVALDFIKADGSTFAGSMLVAEIDSKQGAFALALLRVQNEPALA